MKKNPNKIQFWLQAIALIAFAFTSPAFGQSGYDIIKQVQDQARLHANQKYDIAMEIQDIKKRKRKRYFASWNKYNDQQTLGLVRFYRPANLAGTGMLSTKEESSASHQWLYIPAFQSVRKLSHSDRNKSFMGSDFSNADVGGRGLDEDVHTLISENEKTYQVDSVPKSSEDAYGKIKHTVIKSLKVIKRSEFYDHEDKLIKILTSKKVKPHKGMYVVVNSIMENPNTGGQTVLTIENIDTTIKKPDNFYSTIGLRQ